MLKWLEKLLNKDYKETPDMEISKDELMHNIKDQLKKRLE